MIFTVIMNRQADYVRHLRRMPMTMRCAGNPWLDEGYEIVHFTISSEMSTAYNQAMLAAEETGMFIRWIQEPFQPVSVCLYWKPVDLREQGLSAEKKLRQKCVRTQINAVPVSLWMS